MEIGQIPEIRECLYCGNERINQSSNGYFCSKCNSFFVYDEINNVWKGSNILDISYQNSESSILSNLFPHKFTLKEWPELHFESMEAFLRVLCCENDRNLIREIHTLYGTDAVRVKTALPDWTIKQQLNWKGQIIDRESEEYKKLLEDAFDSLFDCSPLFRIALGRTFFVDGDDLKRKKLIHTMGKNNPKETLLTQSEFISLLNRERDRL